MKNSVITILFVFCLAKTGISACFLVAEKQQLFNEQVIIPVAILEISRYVEPISEIPPAGVSQEDCHYGLNITETNDGFLLLVKGPNLNSYANSQTKNLQGFQRALFRAIIKEHPQHEVDICKRNRQVMKTDCNPVEEKAPVIQSEFVFFDEASGLSWQKQEPGKMNWKKATTYCQDLSLDEMNDWRLPEDKEIRSTHLIDYHFPELNQNYYWSSTIDPDDKDYAMGYSVTSNSLFSDWIKNRYFVRCVRGSQKAMMRPVGTLQEDGLEKNVALVAEDGTENIENPTGIRWVVGPTLFSGYMDVIDIYLHNLEELGYSKEEGSAGNAISASFNPYWQMESGMRYGAGIGPLMSAVIAAGEKEYTFVALPININAGYTFSNGFFLRGGISMLNASGDFVVSESAGLLGAAGIEFNRKKVVSLGFEVGLNTASVELEKYDCSEVLNPDTFTACKKETTNLQPVGIMTSFIVVF
jgi:Protein of unknown function (DUF1566)